MEQDEKFYRDMMAAIILAGVLADGKIGDARMSAEYALICLEEMEKALENSKH